MDDDLSPQSTGSNGSIGVQNDNKLNEFSGGIDAIGETGSSSSSRRTVHKPLEMKLVQFATQLVILERLATGIGALGGFWAATVLLGNLANISYRIDFYFITIILLTESARIFSLSHDLEWRLESPWTISSSCRDLAQKVIKGLTKSRDLKAGKTNDQEDPQLLPDADDLFVHISSNFMSKLLYWLQLLSAISCITLSVVRIIQLSLGDPIDPSSSGVSTNIKPALYVFYVLAFAQAFLSLSEKVYWEWTITCRKLLDEVNKDCDELGMNHIRSFFYHAYSKCVNGKVFDGLLLDLFSFASKLLNSHSRREQLIGVQILHKLSTNPRYYDTLRNIGTSMPVMEKLLYMLSWKKSEDAEIRRTAAEIVIKLAGRSWKSFQVSGFPGALEYISALLDDPSSDDQIGPEQKYFATLGIKILTKLSYNHDNCEEIAHTRRLLLKLLDGLEDPVLRNHSAKILDNLCKKVGKDCFKKLGGVVAVAPKVLRVLMKSEENEQLEQMLALTTELLKFMTSEQAKLVFEKIGGSRIDDVTEKLCTILNKNKAILIEPPKSMSLEELDKVRRTTCNAIILAIDTMGKIKNAVLDFNNSQMEEELRQIQKATRSDMECKYIHEYVEMALQSLAEG